jgi:hypothetical protein
MGGELISGSTLRSLPWSCGTLRLPPWAFWAAMTVRPKL